MIFNTAKVMSKGQITLPIDIRKNMSLSTGDRVALIYDNNRVIMLNPATYATETLQKGLEGGEASWIDSADDLNAFMCELNAKAKDI